MSSNTNDSVAKVTGTTSAVGGLDRFTAQFFETSYISEIVGTGDALTVVVAVFGVSALMYMAVTLGLVDFDDY
jgi:hydroxyethylthiazole kinase-like sugar kinase family protein